MEEEAKIPEGFEAMVAGEIIPEGAMWLGKGGTWRVASGTTIGNAYYPSIPEIGKYSHAIHVKPIKAPNWHDNLYPDMPAPKDPKTKYHRPMYPAWNDPQVHTDANGHQYLNVDVYSVLAAFDPGHEVAHAVKKLLAAGTRDKGSKIQDYREAIISIEAAIYRAEIEGGAG